MEVNSIFLRFSVFEPCKVHSSKSLNYRIGAWRRLNPQLLGTARRVIPLLKTLNGQESGGVAGVTARLGDSLEWSPGAGLSLSFTTDDDVDPGRAVATPSVGSWSRAGSIHAHIHTISLRQVNFKARARLKSNFHWCSTVKKGDQFPRNRDESEARFAHRIVNDDHFSKSPANVSRFLFNEFRTPGVVAPRASRRSRSRGSFQTNHSKILYISL